MWHDQQIRSSLSQYQTYLNYLAADGLHNGAAGEAIAGLVHINQIAADRAAGELPHIPLEGFSSASFNGLTDQQSLSLINPYALGYGQPEPFAAGICAAPGQGLMVIGTEHAYNPRTSPRCLAVEGCALSALWAANATPEEIARVGGVPDHGHEHGPNWNELNTQFMRDPSVAFPRRAAGHTWRKAAYTLFGATNDEAVSEVFRRAYMMELSVMPALQAVDGLPVNEVRNTFLRQVFSSCGALDDAGVQEVRTLWFHGNGRNAAFAQARQAAIRAFLGLGVDEPLPNPQLVTVGKLAFPVHLHAGRMVVITRALSGASATPHVYWASVGSLLRPRLGLAP